MGEDDHRGLKYSHSAKKVYRSIDELQADLDLWIHQYNEQRPHQGRWCFGKTPMQTFLDAMPMAKEKFDRPPTRTALPGSPENRYDVPQIRCSSGESRLKGVPICPLATSFKE
jgi:Integrase core domain